MSGLRKCVVHADRIFVEDGRIFTSAGVTAGLDLALHIIGKDLGHRVAAAVARAACMSRRNLARLFSEHAACSPLDYVQRMRVALARELIAQSRLDLERVADGSKR